MTLSRAPAFTIRRTLADNWDASRVDDFGPGATNEMSITTGLYDEAEGLPVVLVTDVASSVQDYGMNAGGVAQLRRGAVTVGAWVGEKVERGGTPLGTIGAEKLRWLIGQEIRRIIRGREIAEIQYIDVTADTQRVDTEQSPAIYIRELTVEFTWVDLP